MPNDEGGSVPPLSTPQAERLHRLAHDLRNRVAGALEAVRSLHERPDGMDPAELSSFAERNLFQALRDIESALDDLGVERGPGKMRMEPVDLTHLLNGTLADVRPRLQRKAQTAITEVGEGLQVVGDPEILRQLVHALMTNASKFSAAGSEIRVSAAEQNGQVIVRVEDRGVGLSPSDLQELFVRYAWLTSRSTEGEGQARSTLARARQWATLHQGSLEAESKGIGKGTRFTLRLPAP